jgi:hypothetical protein
MSSAENTRNFYRNQGIKIERDRIVELLEQTKSRLEKIETGHNAGSHIMSVRTTTIEHAIKLIKGDVDA